MTRRLNLLCVLALTMLFSTMALGQTMIYDDAVVKDPDGQHKEWKEGKTKYPSKPKDMWELGLHGGYLTIQGDVNSQPGWAVGAHLRKSLGYSFAIRFNGMYGIAKGLNFQPSSVGAFKNSSLRNVTNRDGVKIPGYGRNQAGTSGTGNPFYYNFKNTYIEAGIQGVLTLNNLKFHKERNKWDLFLMAGPVMQMYQLEHDALNANDQTYGAEMKALQAASYGTNPTYDLDTKQGRKDIRDALKNLLDGEYETTGEAWGNLWNLGGDDNTGEKRINFGVNVGAGLGYHLSKRITLTLEHQATFTDDDLQDGYRWAEQGDFTRDIDIPQYSSLRLNFHLGSKKKRVEPLWWLNPLDAPYEQIAKNTQKKSGDELTDDDGDGVPNKLDREPNTPADCPVDTRGVTLDSDSDGIPDCQDKEPYSPPGYPVDPQGVAQVPTPEGPDLSDYVRKGELPAPQVITQTVAAAPSGCSGDWFLPMIHFDLDKYYLKPEFYPQLHHVATVLKRCPNIQIVVKGHTDVRLPSEYNQVLSYKRAEKAINYLVSNYNIDRSRLVLNYGGEVENLVPNLPDNHAHSKEKEISQYMNRRVEFIVADGTQYEMGIPSYQGRYESVGKDTPKSSRGGQKYSGNPGAGY